jgi:excinuclease ABC subunit C
MFSSLLEGAPGNGEVRKKELLKKFGSLKKMKEASIEELSDVIGKDVAEKLHTYLQEIEK